MAGLQLIERRKSVGDLTPKHASDLDALYAEIKQGVFDNETLVQVKYAIEDLEEEAVEEEEEEEDTELGLSPHAPNLQDRQEEFSDSCDEELPRKAKKPKHGIVASQTFSQVKLKLKNPRRTSWDDKYFCLLNLNIVNREFAGLCSRDSGKNY